jgi:hypothetical protein
VPTANAQIELQHSEDLESDYAEFASTVDRVALLGSAETVSLDAGLRYPSRLFLINPPPADYTFVSTDPASVRVENIRAAADDEANDYLEEVSGTIVTDTQSYSLRTDYSQYQSAPSFNVEAGATYKRFGNDELAVIESGSIVNGRRLTIVTYEGEFAEGSTETLSFAVESMAGRMQPLSVTSETPGDEIVVSLPTSLTEAEWVALLEDEYDPNGYVVTDSVDVTDDVLTFRLVADQVYDLRLGKLSVGAGRDDLAAHYMVKGASSDPVISAGGTDLSVQVRNELNNPVSGVSVTFSTEDGTFRADPTPADGTHEVTTDEDGYASARFVPVTGASEANIRVAGDLDESGTVDDPRESVEFGDLQVGPEGSGGSGEFDINPAGNGAIAQDKAELIGCTDGSTGGIPQTDQDCVVHVTFQSYASIDKTPVEGRLNFYQPGQGFKGQGNPFNVRDGPTGVSFGGKSFTIGDGFKPITLATVASGDSIGYDFEFQLSGQRYNAAQGDYFVVTLVFDDESVGTYFVSPVFVGGDSDDSDDSDDGTTTTGSVSSVDPSDVTSSDTEQIISFTVDSALSSGEQVIVNLDAAQAKTGGVDYGSATVSASTTGSVDLTVSSNEKDASITYTADGSETTTSTVTLTVTGISVEGTGSWTVEATGPDSSTVSSTFEAS